MDIKKVFEEGNLSKYLIKGVSPAFMNAVRRTIINNVPCLAVDEVTFYENDSVVFDEMLANRLGLLPIKTDVKAYKIGDTVKLVLEKAGPCDVTSKDIKCTDPKIEIVDKKIIITKLGKEERVKLEMTAKMSVGSEHARFQPAIVSFNELPKINNNSSHKNTKELIEAMPKGTIEEKAGKLFLLDPYNIKTQNQFENILEKFGVELEYTKDEFVLSLETTGQLSSIEVINSALDQLNTKLDELNKEIKKA
ncbi:MAG: DNA-directed RNA polymerase subunit D [Candidatus Diapherotrites archaeon]|jgi:DNA-directed RNA polymerase subunit D|uniref:DNA-directed RNA polymerase subunit Rpo3 n=1 Tax=Candidatus Iainarchaeum sp. TaxID=3101447 RepID=A0A8T5GEP4_9ARCH|nr:DNA-directed RNA polymerase subunit D [Candidatus Diapherotrites archaeon]MBT7241782.1 DNA-directed RNA polymerase subunit D [Candidatus Diapherotrites archaeon]